MLNIHTYIKEPFTVIGKEGSTSEGSGFVQRLWTDANAHFGEIAHLAKRDAEGNLLGIWGAMSDEGRNFLPWEDGFSRGLYLAGVECTDEAAAPEGWSKWVIPGFEYLYTQCLCDTVFQDMIAYLRDNRIPLAGAVQDFTCPETGQNFMFFPVRRL